MSRRHVALARCGWVLAIFLAVSPSMSSAAMPSYECAGTGCHDAIATLTADATRARTEIPPRFAITGDALGRAVLFATFTSCDLSLNSGASTRTTFSDVGVAIGSPDGSLGLHFYV
jgi:hypothetical protein